MRQVVPIHHLDKPKRHRAQQTMIRAFSVYQQAAISTQYTARRVALYVLCDVLKGLYKRIVCHVWVYMGTNPIYRGDRVLFGARILARLCTFWLTLGVGEPPGGCARTKFMGSLPSPQIFC